MLAEMEKRETNERERNRRVRNGYSNVMLVRILRETQNPPYGEPEGEILHRNLLKPVPYRGLAELIFRIEGIAQLLNLRTDGREDRYPSLGTGPGAAERILPEEYCRILPTERQGRDNFGRELYLKKSQEVVYVELLGRHHKSIQGRLRCRGTGEQYVYFRSALDLMNFFSELSQNEGKRQAVYGSQKDSEVRICRKKIGELK